jgi:hypothetical protein
MDPCAAWPGTTPASEHIDFVMETIPFMHVAYPHNCGADACQQGAWRSIFARIAGENGWTMQLILLNALTKR